MDYLPQLLVTFLHLLLASLDREIFLWTPLLCNRHVYVQRSYQHVSILTPLSPCSYFLWIMAKTWPSSIACYAENVQTVNETINSETINPYTPKFISIQEPSYPSVSSITTSLNKIPHQSNQLWSHTFVPDLSRWYISLPLDYWQSLFSWGRVSVLDWIWRPCFFSFPFILCVVWLFFPS